MQKNNAYHSLCTKEKVLGSFINRIKYFLISFNLMHELVIASIISKTHRYLYISKLLNYTLNSKVNTNFYFQLLGKIIYALNSRNNLIRTLSN